MLMWCFINLLHLIFWTSFSRWTQSLLASLAQILFPSASSNVLELQASNWHVSQTFVWELDIWTQILMLAWQALYPMTYFSQPSICYLFNKSLWEFELHPLHLVINFYNLILLLRNQIWLYKSKFPFTENTILSSNDQT